MNSNLSIPLLLLTFSTAAIADINMTIGDGLIDGDRLEPYQLTWQQCRVQDSQWQNQGSLTEEFVIIGDNMVRHRQMTRTSDGTVSQFDTFFERSSLAPLRMEIEVTKDGNRLVYSERELGAKGYTGTTIKGEDSKKLQGIISSNMLHGGALGLPLAAMDYQTEPVEFLASMIGFDATYVVNARWVGKEVLEFDGQRIEAWLIDVKWHHRESGDVYPPGPDASGGRYWVVPNPPVGFPYAPRYKTDTYAIEFVSSICPTAAETP